MTKAYRRKDADVLAARNEALASDYRAGLSLREVAVLYRITRQRAHQVLVELGVPRRTIGRGETP